jgi:hypothetical protein
MRFLDDFDPVLELHACDHLAKRLESTQDVKQLSCCAG